jgi:hypothetical protein
MLPVNPFAPVYHFLLHHGGVGGRASEGEKTQLQKDQGYFTESVFMRLQSGNILISGINP